MDEARKKSYNTKGNLTTAKKPQDPSIWTLNLIGYSKIAQQYYCELHSKRPQALLGPTDFSLPYELTEEGILKVKREHFKRLEELVKEKILHDPSYVNKLIISRRKKLAVLQKTLQKEDTLLESGSIENCNPLQTFSSLTDYACYYLEYNFPNILFKQLLVEKLGYSEDAYENLRMRLLTPSESAYFTYYKAVLEYALQKLNHGNIDLRNFKKRFSCIGDRELKIRSDKELTEAIERTALMFGNGLLIRHEIAKITSIENNIRKEHAKIKEELLQKSRNKETQVSHLISSLTDMLIEAALENEQTSIWRGRVFAYLTCLIKSLNMEPHKVSIEELQSKINSLKKA